MHDTVEEFRRPCARNLMTNSKRVLNRVGAGVAAMCLLAAGPIYAMHEKRFEPEPFNESELKALGNLNELRPHLRRLAEAARSGALVGAPAESYRDELRLADEVRHLNKATAYVFYVQPDKGFQEGYPLLAIFEQNKFGQIYRVVAGAPCY